MLNFESDIENLQGKYLLNKLIKLQKYVLYFQYMTFNYQIFPLTKFYITFKIQHSIACSRFIRPFGQGSNMHKNFTKYLKAIRILTHKSRIPENIIFLFWLLSFFFFIFTDVTISNAYLQLLHYLHFFL